ncbi:MAG: hypothetical protein RQ745_01355 [Longimicrobiales bacterium]|nr:hypothetical protein [Longimicrobiales bacterium]
MSGFLGRYEHQLDEKGRVSLPSAFRKEAGGDPFVLLQWEKPYLTLFPQAVWTEVESRLLEFRKSRRAAWNHVREILANATEVAPDKQGRILVPGTLKTAAELDGTVILNGNIDRIEIWSPEKWSADVECATSEELTDFGHRIFG